MRRILSEEFEQLENLIPKDELEQNEELREHLKNILDLLSDG